MSTPPQPPQPQPGNPYASGPMPPQPGPYGPPHAAAPQGVPPQYPGQGPAQGGWGQPQAPFGQPVPPPRKNRTGLILGIVGGVVLVVVLIVGGLAFLSKSLYDGVESSFPEAKYKLTVPKTLLGDYNLVTDSSATEGKEVEETIDPTVRDAKAAIAQYEGENASVLVVSGFHGRLSDPDGTRDLILEGAVEDPNTTLVVPPKDFRPAGHDVTISCQVARSKDGGVTSTLPMCAWGDGNTASFVAVVTAETAVMDPKKVDLASVAETTAKVRAEMRKPIG
ncbi:hypothetical protein ACGFMM_05135 [Streptomyces sp. NPDC048604]|uniref:hypothetical protein n=1 Tax=Streptomyces sp. NPDC048604 TaxID=3365578 RepID=UPI0037148874